MAQPTYEQLERAVLPWVRKGDVKRAIAICEKELAALPRTEYHAALGRSWLAQTEEASAWLAAFCRGATKALALRAVYCEMNRFEINADEWHIHAFAYDFFGEPEEPDWLIGWKKSSADRRRFVLRGMADLQALFARDYRDAPPSRIRGAAEVVILLLTLRMQELIDAVALRARRSGELREDVPVLATAHDSDLVYCSYGRVKPASTRPEPARPAVSHLRRSDDRRGVYRIDGGNDEFGNSLPWDVLDYSSLRAMEKYEGLYDETKPLADRWKPPRVKVRKRKWRCDLISLYPFWAINDKARAALMPLLGKSVEFLPLHCPQSPSLWALHSLRYVDLAAKAVHNGEPGRNMTVIDRYAFDVEDLAGKHYFGIHQSPGSPARQGGYCFGGDYVSEEFRRVVEANGLQGVVFQKVFSYLGEDAR